MTKKLMYILIALPLALPAGLWAQLWTGAGSNGSDGALNLTLATPGVLNGVLIFDPVALNLDVDGDNVYHFTTINIANGLTVKLALVVPAGITTKPGS